MSILQEISVPQETVNDEFVTVAKKYYNNGDSVKPGDILIDIETSKTVVDIEAEQGGFIEYFCEEGDDITVGSIIIKIYDKALEVSADEGKESSADSAEQATSTVETLFSKDALALMKENNIDKSHFAGRDFVSVDDVRGLLNPTQNSPRDIVTNENRIEVEPPRVDTGKVELKRVSAHKRTEINYLSQVQSSGLISTINIYVNVEGIFRLVNKSMDVFKNSLLPLITYEVARLLKKHREFNAYFAGNNIVYYNEVHVGIAVDIDDGLKVLKIPNTDKKDLKEIEKEIFDLSNKYLDKQLDYEDITGSTFTITDLSSEKVDFFVPLINKEQSAILGISSIDDKLKRCVLSLTFDHRVTEGKKAGIFLTDLRYRIESYKLTDEGEEDGESMKTIKDLSCSICLKTLEEDEELNGLGLIKILDHTGAEKNICQVCLSRF